MDFNKQTIIFGTGDIASSLMFWENELKIAYFIDNNAKSGDTFWGYDVKHPKEILQSEFECVILATIKYEDEMKRQLLGMGVSKEKIIHFKELDLYDINNDLDENKEEHSNILNTRIRNKNEFYALKYDKELLEIEMVMKEMVLHSPEKRMYYPSICQVCNKKTNLLIDDKFAPGIGKVNFRERMVCPFCEMNNRQRVIARHIVDTVSYPWSSG